MRSASVSILLFLIVLIATYKNKSHVFISPFDVWVRLQIILKGFSPMSRTKSKPSKCQFSAEIFYKEHSVNVNWPLLLFLYFFLFIKPFFVQQTLSRLEFVLCFLMFIISCYLLTSFLVNSKLNFPVGSLAQFFTYFKSEIRACVRICRIALKRGEGNREYQWHLMTIQNHLPVLKLPFVVIELYPPCMLHTPHNVDHVLLVDAHLEGVDNTSDLIDGGQETGFHWSIFSLDNILSQKEACLKQLTIIL